MAIQDKKKGTTPADRKAQIDAANKRTAAKIAQKRRAASAAGKGVAGAVGARAKASGKGVAGAVGAAAKFIGEYTVKKGDTLSAIAKKYYGSGAKPYYELIQKANTDIIKDVNLIYPDQVFKIPVLPPELKK